jgi:hypothetical protein
MAKLLRAAAWIALGAITVVSLVPPSSRLVTAVPHDLEHLMIFGTAGLALA